jgi:peptidoglycan/xylan/chitin deacetylase (PgdA/CDA1 family)
MGFGPERLATAPVLTFDNLGEASELERGTWPTGAPLGTHPAVTDALPRLLDELAANELSATFFIEAINCELYPDALLEIATRGHEIAMHGWRHELWSELAPAHERDALRRGIAAFATLGIGVNGFRPPGGALTRASPALLCEAGISWCSPAGGSAGVRDRLAFVPFERDRLAFVPFDWELVDAYHLMGRFGPLRAARGDTSEPLDPIATAARMFARLAQGGGLRTVILHPFLMLDDAWFAGVRKLLSRIASLARSGDTWVVPGGRFARWLTGRGG